MSSPSPPQETNDEHAFSISLTVYSKIKKMSKGKITSKEDKSTKTKELIFAINSSNYLDFLQNVLLKHGQKSYEVTEKKHYPFRYIPLKAKRQHASDAIDVDNIADYKETVKKVVDKKPTVVKIFVDMCHIEKLPHTKSRSSGSEDDSEPASNGDNELQKAYKNEHDEGLTYIGPFGTIQLTPAMVLDWSHALEEGQATIATPPNIESFNLANKALEMAPSSPLVSLPSHFSCYLKYVETHLGVHHASAFESAFQLHGIGPDILPDINDKVLSDLGISAGDIIHLKKGSVACGPPMQQDDDPPPSPIEHDYDLFYCCEIHKQWLPVPHGYLVDEDEDPKYSN
ncbi:hypothetical protein SCLCIDRAFT_18538 [Scleroderma citrinum Foug A]|uniref:Uncharacterized protein n=1 Tax=Scleroderma citrinum Foug A TaxID=1036808 RepID=A0A0C3D2F9_9AGAM|nr:hypothetical protein SCLCIDRAFT_18538 [Scleroderma citrinum Foug A]